MRNSLVDPDNRQTESAEEMLNILFLNRSVHGEKALVLSFVHCGE